ncbi:MAG: thioredoxin domain-containing protein, partial [Gemmatimonadales bacterium]
ALAVVGAGAILVAMGQDSEPVEVGPVPVNVAAFPGYVLGSDSAPVEIVEYADFGCAACAYFAVLTGPDIKERLVNTGRVRWRFRDFIGPSHPNSLDAHLAAGCAGEQGQFWSMHDQIMFNQQRWSRESRPARALRDYARAIGLDMGRYDACVESQHLVARFEAVKQEGRAIGLAATPSFVIDGMLYTGAIPYDSLVVLVERAEAARNQ